MMMNDRYLNKLPLASLLLELDTSFLVKRHSTSVDDGGGKDAKCQLDSACSLQKNLHSLDRRQSLALKVRRLGSTGRDFSCGIDKLLQGDVTVTALTVKVAILIGRVFNIERVVLTISSGLLWMGQWHSRRAFQCRPRRRCILCALGQP